MNVTLIRWVLVVSRSSILFLKMRTVRLYGLIRCMRLCRWLLALLVCKLIWKLLLVNHGISLYYIRVRFLLRNSSRYLIVRISMVDDMCEVLLKYLVLVNYLLNRNVDLLNKLKFLYVIRLKNKFEM